MASLIEFLLARVDEIDRPVTTPHPAWDSTSASCPQCAKDYIYPIAGMPRDLSVLAPHLWTPPAGHRIVGEYESICPVVTRRAQAMRMILSEHAPSSGCCRRCVDLDTLHATDEPDGLPMVTFPCQTLRLIAEPYDQHHDYDPAWRPAA